MNWRQGHVYYITRGGEKSNIKYLILIGLGYGFMGLLVLSPALIACGRGGWRGIRGLGAAAGFFLVALALRQMDDWAAERFMPMGTHFLWHIFGAVAVHFAFKFVYGIEEGQAPLGVKCLGNKR